MNISDILNPPCTSSMANVNSVNSNGNVVPMLPNGGAPFLDHHPSSALSRAAPSPVRPPQHHHSRPMFDTCAPMLQGHSSDRDMYTYYEGDSDGMQGGDGSGKPRNRFTEYEDAVICEGVAKGLTWGQISSQLPNRKRATCFNRYRTLQGIRKSRRRASSFRLSSSPYMMTPPASRRASIVSISTRGSYVSTPSPSPPLPSATWFPSKDAVNAAVRPPPQHTVRHWMPELVMDRSSSSSAAWMEEYHHHGHQLGYRF